LLELGAAAPHWLARQILPQSTAILYVPNLSALIEQVPSFLGCTAKFHVRNRYRQTCDTKKYIFGAPHVDAGKNRSHLERPIGKNKRLMAFGC